MDDTVRELEQEQWAAQHHAKQEQANEERADAAEEHARQLAEALRNVASTNEYADGHTELCWCHHEPYGGPRDATDHEKRCLNATALLAKGRRAPLAAPTQEERPPTVSDDGVVMTRRWTTADLMDMLSGKRESIWCMTEMEDATGKKSEAIMWAATYMHDSHGIDSINIRTDVLREVLAAVNATPARPIAREEDR